MTGNQMQKLNTGTGPGVPASVRVHPVIYYPTPKANTSLNMVKRSEIVASPAKGVNNLESSNNNQASTQVYLHDKEKKAHWLNKSITSSNLSIKNEPIDRLSEEEETWKEEYDEEVAEEVNEAIKAIERAYRMPDGMMNIRRCKKYVEQIKRIEEAFKNIREAV